MISTRRRAALARESPFKALGYCSVELLSHQQERSTVCNAQVVTRVWSHLSQCRLACVLST